MSLGIPPPPFLVPWSFPFCLTTLHLHPPAAPVLTLSCGCDQIPACLHHDLLQKTPQDYDKFYPKIKTARKRRFFFSDLQSLIFMECLNDLCWKKQNYMKLGNTRKAGPQSHRTQAPRGFILSFFYLFFPPPNT